MKIFVSENVVPASFNHKIPPDERHDLFPAPVIVGGIPSKSIRSDVDAQKNVLE